MDTDIVEKEIESVVSPEQCLAMLDRLKWLKEWAGEKEASVRDCLKLHIEATGEPIMAGEIKWYVGTKKTTRCKNPKALLEWFFGNAFDQLPDCLSSNAFKHGACKDPLGDRWKEFFEVEEKAELVDGKPSKSLQNINTRFLK